MTGPLVSVIIPTSKRPVLVQRAIRSVFAQTMADLELIIIVDGPNAETRAVLAGLADPRLRVVQNEQPMGPGAARNRGGALARGEWIAVLDDDDEWLPEKLERQLAFAEGRSLFLCCRAKVVTPQATYVWPRNIYDGSTSVDDYLFDRRTPFRGAAHLSTSSFMLPRSVFLKTQFGETRHNEDLTLVLRVTKQAGVPMTMVPEVLVVQYVEEARESLGGSYDWREMLAWADSMRDLLTQRAYSGICLIYLGSQAARQRDYKGFPLLLGRAWRRGRPSAMQVFTFLAFWVMPVTVRRKLRSLLAGGRASEVGA